MPVGFPDYYGGLTLPVTVEEGGTGQTSFTAHSVLIGQGTSGLTASNVGTAGQVLQVPSGGGDPVFQNFSGAISPSSLTIAPYALDSLLLGETGDLPATHAAMEIAAPAAATADPLLVCIDTSDLLRLDISGNLTLAGSFSPQVISFNVPSGTTVIEAIETTFSASLNIIEIYASSPTATILYVGNGVEQVYISPSYRLLTTAGIFRFTSGCIFQFQAAAVRFDDGTSFTCNMPQTVVAPSGTSVDPFDVYLSATPLLQLDTTGNLTLAGALTLGSPLAVNQGGTGTSSPSLTAGTGIGISGTWPDNTITNTSNYASLADPLPAAHGGTGTSSPSLSAGTGIGISGTWPDNTITNTSNYASLADPLPAAHGGTGAASLDAAGLPTVAGSVDLTGQTSSIANTTIITPTAAGMYRVDFELQVDSSTGSSSFLVYLEFTQNGHTGNFTILNETVPSASVASYSAHRNIYIDASTAISYSTSFSSGGGSDNYDLHIRLTKVPA